MRDFSTLSLSTPRLLLRPLQTSDAAALFAMHADAEVMQYWSSTPWTSITQAEEKIASDLEELPKGEHLRLALVLRDSGELIGTASLFNFFAQCRRAELGYVLARSFWGQGYMSEALQALVQYAFEQLDLLRLEADIDPRNLASEKSLLRLGFVQEGFLRERWIIDGVTSDAALFGLLRREWLGPKSFHKEIK